jgi:hypothetical protein
MSYQLSPGQFYQKDPLLRLLRDRLNARTIWMALPALLVYSAIFLLVPYLVLASRPQFETMLGNLSIQCLLHALGIAVYVRLPDELADLFNSLERNDVFDDAQNPDANLASYDDMLVARVDRYLWALAALLVVVCFWAYRIGGGTEWSTLSYVQSRWRVPLIVLRALVYAPAEYGLIISAIRFVISLRFTSELFHAFPVRLNPLHPDGCGGVGAIGRLLTHSVLVAVMIAMGAAGMAFVASASGVKVLERPETWLLGIGYLITIPALFVGWLAEPHRAMKAARDVALHRLSEQFTRAMSETMSSSCEDSATIKASTDRLTEMARQCGFLKATIPVFPVRMDAARWLLLTSLAPVVTSLLLRLLEALAPFLSRR